MIKTVIQPLAIAIVCLWSSLSFAQPNTDSFDGVVDFVNVSPDAVDKYGIGIHSIGIGTSMTVTFTTDSDIGAVSRTASSDPSTKMSYYFTNPPYGGQLFVASNTVSSNESELYVENDFVPPPEQVPQRLVDLGFPTDGITPVDVVWLGARSNDFTWNNGSPDGLEFSIEYYGVGGDLLADLSLPAAVPAFSDASLVLLTIEQWDQGNKVFEAHSVVYNNLTPSHTVPFLPQVAMWIMGGLMFTMMSFFRLPRHRLWKNHSDD